MTEKRPSHDEQLQSSVPSSRSLNLGLLAARAAVALDQRARGESAPIEPVHEFGSALVSVLGLDRAKPEGTPQPSAESREKFGIWPLNTAALFQRALVSNYGVVAQSFDDLMTLARDTASELTRVDDETSPERSSELRDVSLAISRAAQMQHARVRSPMSPRTSR